MLILSRLLPFAFCFLLLQTRIESLPGRYKPEPFSWSPLLAVTSSLAWLRKPKLVMLRFFLAATSPNCSF